MGRLVGVVPAAGQATRMEQIPWSKEMIPVGFQEVITENGIVRRPKPVGLHVIECMVAAGSERILMIIGNNKWDIPSYFGNGADFGTDIAYLMQTELRGLPFALDLAKDWLLDATVLFGMPDTIFYPMDAFEQLLKTHQSKEADLTLGLFPTSTPDRFGMVSFDNQNRMVNTIDKPSETDLEYLWGIACWGPVFTRFLAQEVQSLQESPREAVLGDIFQAALESGLSVSVTPFSDGEYIDIGTPDDLANAIVRFAR